MRRMLLLADVVGLIVAFVLANVLMPTRASSGDNVSPDGEYIVFLARDPAVDPAAPARGPLRPGRGAHRPLHGRRHRRRLPQRHDRGLALRPARHRDRPRPARARPARSLLDPRGRCWFPTLRAVARVICRHMPGYAQNALIVGGGRVGQQLALKLMNHREYGIRLVGFVDDRPTELDDELAAAAPAASRWARPAARVRHRARRRARDRRLLERLARVASSPTSARFATLTCRSTSCPALLRGLRRWGRGAHARGDPARRASGRRGSPARRGCSSGRSICRAAALGLLVLAPLFATVAVAIKLESRGPGVLPPGAPRGERHDVPDLQVPHDGRRGGGRRRPRSCTSTCTATATRG